jgi:hypothetical protein
LKNILADYAETYDGTRPATVLMLIGRKAISPRRRLHLHARTAALPSPWVLSSCAWRRQPFIASASFPTSFSGNVRSPFGNKNA